MSDQAKTEPSCEAHGSGGPWYPLRKWWPSSRLFNQDVGLPPFLEPGDRWWMNVDWLQRSLAAAAAPLFVPYISGSMHHPGQEISQERCTWRLGLDVAHFAPAELSLSVKDGFLEVGGRHEERRDEHGFIARCFTRKYRLPAEIDATKITSTLSVDGILTVEAPVPETSAPAAIIIPIKVEVPGEEEEKPEEEETVETEPDSSREAPEAPKNPEDPVEEDSAAEALAGQAHPGSATAGPQQHDEREQEETHDEPVGESHPSASADGSGTETLQESTKQDEATGNQEIPDTDTSKQPEHKEPAVGAEIQVMSGSAEEITQPEEPELGTSPLGEAPSQEPEATDTQPEHAE